jgi:aspartyl-tRNA(Asn)/glutamyl-tRNA(Gln) amidotransferase subunit B
MKEETLPYRYIIGLEIHVELATQTKMFCRCENAPFSAKPNQHTCPICLGLPGTLPVPNQEAVRRAILVGKALGSEISHFCKFDRKHYFYPDLPKGYQISQYDLPICIGGELSLLDEKGEISSTVHFERVHLEEDAGKLLHSGKQTKVDLNRAGVPLIEMVTKPDLTSPQQARNFMQELRLLMRTLKVSEADMEKGQMRCDVNVNIAFEHDGKLIKTPITEVKNVNSTRAVERSLVIEAARQYEEWMAGGPIRKRQNKITAGWDEDKGAVSVSRVKEEANDYRYFPEPDIPPLRVYENSELDPAKINLPELPNALRKRYLEVGLSWIDIETLLADPQRWNYLENCTHSGLPPKLVANWLINAAECVHLAPEQFGNLLDLVSAGSVSFAAVKPKLGELIEGLIQDGDKNNLINYLKQNQLWQENDNQAIDEAIQQVLVEQAAAVQDFRAGNERIFGFLVGQVMKKVAGKGSPPVVQSRLKELLEA